MNKTNTKGDLEIDKIVVWILALIILIILIFLAFKYKEKLLDIINRLGDIFRFGI